MENFASSSSIGYFDHNASSSSSTGARTNETWSFSKDPVFLTTLPAIWANILLWNICGCAVVFFGAGIHAVRVNCDTKTPKYYFLYIPLFALFFGAVLGFCEGAISAALIGATAVAINQSVGTDIAAGLGRFHS